MRSQKEDKTLTHMLMRHVQTALTYPTDSVQ